MKDKNRDMRSGERDSSVELDKIDIEKLLYTQIRTQEIGEELIEVALAEIKYIASELDIEERVKQVGEAIYRRSLEHKLVENRTIGDVSAASLFAACKVESRAYTQKNFARTARGTSNRSLSRTYAEISRQLELKTGPIEPHKFIPGLVEELTLSERTQERAEEIIQTIVENDPKYLSGRSPVIVAAAAVYSASLLEDEATTQQEVADAAEISIKPIRVHYQSQIEIYAEQALSS